MKECQKCGFNNEYGYCECPHSDKWYTCPIENKKPENIQALKEYAEWLPQYEGKWVADMRGARKKRKGAERDHERIS